MSKQSSLNETLAKSFERGYLTDETLQSLQNRFEALTIPTHANPQFNAREWLQFIQNCSGISALELRKRYGKDTQEYRILTALAAHYQQDEEYTVEAFNIEEHGVPNEWLYPKVVTFTKEVLIRYPLAVLLPAWVPEISVCSRDVYEHKLPEHKSSSGYYHPTEHWIAIRYDAGDPDTVGWPVTKQAQKNHYERSVTLHELGHAFHYMCGIQIHNPDDYTDTPQTVQEMNVRLKKEIKREPWQSTLAIDSIKAYSLLINDTYDTIEFGDNSRSTIEEFLAEGFNVYITAPRYLAQEQYRLYAVYAGMNPKI